MSFIQSSHQLQRLLINDIRMCSLIARASTAFDQSTIIQFFLFFFSFLHCLLTFPCFVCLLSVAVAEEERVIGKVLNIHEEYEYISRASSNGVSSMAQGPSKCHRMSCKLHLRYYTVYTTCRSIEGTCFSIYNTSLGLFRLLQRSEPRSSTRVCDIPWYYINLITAA